MKFVCLPFILGFVAVAVQAAPANQLVLSDEAQGLSDGDFIDQLQSEAASVGQNIDWGLDHVAQKANEAEFKLSKLASEEHVGNKLVQQISTNGVGWNWQVCGDYHAVRVDSLDIQPDPPRPGQNLTIKATGQVFELVDEGTYIDVVVKLGLIRLLNKRFDLCEIARKNNVQLQCPLEPGTYELEHTVQLPREIPPARFNVHVTGATQASLDLVCLDLTADFTRR